MWQQWINLILGLWIAVSAYVGFSASVMAMNLLVTGLVVAALSLWGALAHRSEETYLHSPRHA